MESEAWMHSVGEQELVETGVERRPHSADCRWLVLCCWVVCGLLTDNE